MTVDELAEYLKVSTSTVYKMLRNGHLPFLKIGSGFRFDKHEINRWIAARESKN
jgi:excisionase family DNA binding protein